LKWSEAHQRRRLGGTKEGAEKRIKKTRKRLGTLRIQKFLNSNNSISATGYLARRYEKRKDCLFQAIY